MKYSALFHAQLAADEVESLNAVGAFINGSNLFIAHELLDGIFGAKAVAAIDLHGRLGYPEADVRAVGLADGRKYFQDAMTLFLLGIIGRCVLPYRRNRRYSTSGRACLRPGPSSTKAFGGRQGDG